MNDPKKQRHQHPPTTRLEEMRSRVRRAAAGGGPEAAARQHAAGKLTARERIDLLLDAGSFEEVGLLVEGKGAGALGDGVVAGFGRVHGRSICLYAQDYTVWSGTLGAAHARKICKVLDLALEAGLPVVALCDSAGTRLEEGVDSLGGTGDVFSRHALASGRVPQISAILGPCAGGAVYAPALTDFVFMIEGTSHIYMTSPELAAAATGESCSPGGRATPPRRTSRVTTASRSASGRLAYPRQAPARAIGAQRERENRQRCHEIGKEKMRRYNLPGSSNGNRCRRLDERTEQKKNQR